VVLTGAGVDAPDVAGRLVVFATGVFWTGVVDRGELGTVEPVLAGINLRERHAPLEDTRRKAGERPSRHDRG